MKTGLFYILLLLIFEPSLAQSQKQLQKKAKHHLQNVFKKYKFQSMKIALTQEVFLESLQESIKTKGVLNKKNHKFQLKLQGNPGSLLLFDGTFLWYQADLTENIVFQLQDSKHMTLVNDLFYEKSFFQTFKIHKVKNIKNIYVLHLVPKKNIPALKDLFIKVGSHILEIRLVWDNTKDWQKISFKKPQKLAFAKNYFTFSTKNFQIMKSGKASSKKQDKI